METEYKQLKNRCPNCGHRLNMGHGKVCVVVTGEPPRECECKKHGRK